MARLQRCASALCAALLLGACAVDGAGLWGSKKEAAPAKTAPLKATAATTVAKAAVPSGDGHNVYWCAPAGDAGRSARGCRHLSRARLIRAARRYNEVTGEASESDPLVELNGHKSAESDATYWVDPARRARGVKQTPVSRCLAR